MKKSITKMMSIALLMLLAITACKKEEVSVFDCQEMEMNFGDPCPLDYIYLLGGMTMEDEELMIQGTVDQNCNCVENSNIVYDCPELQANIGDYLYLGENGNCYKPSDDQLARLCYPPDCFVGQNCETTPIVAYYGGYDCPQYQANIGDACQYAPNDLSTTMLHGIIDSNCNCVGLTIDYRNALLKKVSIVLSLLLLFIPTCKVINDSFINSTFSLAETTLHNEEDYASIEKNTSNTSQKNNSTKDKSSKDNSYISSTKTKKSALNIPSSKSKTPSIHKGNTPYNKQHTTSKKWLTNVELLPNTPIDTLLHHINVHKPSNELLVIDSITQSALGEGIALNIFSKNQHPFSSTTIDSVENDLAAKDALEVNELNTTSNNDEDSIHDKKWSIGFLIGYGKINRRFHYSSTNEGLAKRSNEEHAIYNYDLSFFITKNISNSLHVGSGISITAYGENVKYTSIPTIRYDTIYSATSSVPPVISINQDIEKDSNGKVANGKTSFSYVEIPLNVGYDMELLKKLQLTTTIGLSTGLLVHKKGKYYYNDEVVKANNKNFVFNYQLGLGIKYALSENMDFIGTSFISSNLTNMSTYSSVTKKYATRRIKLGIAYRF